MVTRGIVGVGLASAVLTLVGLPVSSARAQTLVRQVYISVLDSNGLPIQGLRDIDFGVREDGVNREILSVSRATAPMQVDILVDTSSAARLVIGEMRRAIDGFIEELNDRDQIALITVGGARSVIVEATTSHERLKIGVSRLFARAAAASYLVNALEDTARGFRNRGAQRPVVVVITTNGVDLSTRESQAVATRLRLSRALVHAVVIRTTRPTSPLAAARTVGANHERDEMLDIGPAQTGGRTISLATVNGLAGVLSRLAFELSNQYLVVYASPPTLIPPQVIQIDVNSAEPVTVRAVPARLGGRTSNPR